MIQTDCAPFPFLLEIFGDLDFQRVLLTIGVGRLLFVIHVWRRGMHAQNRGEIVCSKECGQGSD